FPFDWSVLYGPHRPYPVSLPTYAFARERYWIAETGIATAESETGARVSDHSVSPAPCPSAPSRPPAIQREKKLQNGTDTEGKKSASSRRRGALKGFSIAECILWDLKEQASEQLEMGREKLDGDENLAEFGFDSIGLAEYAIRL